MIDHIAVIGGGFSGALHAINLLRYAGPRVTLIERETPGEGLAYGAADDEHLLNVRASNMSAFPDRPNHLVDWLTARGVEDAAGAFIPRTLYGTYLREMLAQTEREFAGRLTIVRGDAVDMTFNGTVTILLAGGRTVEADAASLALGNLPPHTPRPIDPTALPEGSYWQDPWDPGATMGLGPQDTVLIIGTGLTMVDMALLLAKRGFAGPIHALSRRGLLPRPHASDPRPSDTRQEKPTTIVSELVRETRERARKVGWRHAVDELRPFTQPIWRSADAEQKSRFLRHLRAWWDVHRHRLAPQVDARLRSMIASGQLSVHAGKMISAERADKGVEVAWRVRGTDRIEHVVATRIINCTGPEGDLGSTKEPLLRRLMERGLIRPDACGIGIDVNAQAQVIAANGEANPRLLALGPLTRGAFWEINAVPDIRGQVWDIARRLSNAHWVGGEGL